MASSSRHRTGLRIGAAIAAMVVATVLLLVPGTPASATVCYTPGCGGVLYNHSSTSIMVTNCWSGGSTYVGFYPPCTTNYDPWAYDSWMYVAPNDTTLNWYYY